MGKITKTSMLWKLSISLIVLGLVPSFYIMSMSDQRALISVFGLFNDDLSLIFAVILSLGLVSLPIFIYLNFKKRSKRGWIITSALTLLAIFITFLICVFFMFMSEDSYESISKSPDGQYEIVKETSYGFFNSVSYFYFIKTDAVTFESVEFFSSQLNLNENQVQWQEDKLVITDDYEDESLEIRYVDIILN